MREPARPDTESKGNAMKSTESVRTGHRRYPLRWAAALAIVAGLVLVLGVASPAQAAYACGDQKTVRVSIKYGACAMPGSGHQILGKPYWQNNHGSTVAIAWERGRSLNGGAVNWLQYTRNIPAGYSEGPVYAISCTSRDHVRYAQRVKDNNGSWGPTAFSVVFTCP
jgi:hypothetical protein